jgi:hypothetical protein
LADGKKYEIPSDGGEKHEIPSDGSEKHKATSPDCESSSFWFGQSAIQFWPFCLKIPES